MCDTIVALGNVTADGVTILGKNSDREPNEAHHLLRLPAARHPPGSRVKCTYLEIPQVEQTYAVLLAKPFWIWGAEMGANEHGVAIGNEAVFTRVPYDKRPGLIGMDLLRLALERGRTAREALDVITGLLAEYGQGGNCGFKHPTYYHNSFLIADPHSAAVALLAAKAEVLALANQQDPLLVRVGGGARDMEVHVLEHTAVGAMVVVHLIVDVRDAMGANAVNTMAEAVAPRLAEIARGEFRLRIISNLADKRLVHARGVVPQEALATGTLAGEQVVQGIVEAAAFAAADPYRAATHNKGIMNGIDAVVMATGNDWRAIEAGAHAYAARSGLYPSLSTWERDAAGNLVGTLELPLAVGIVGGATKVHPTARVALKVLGVKTARELAEVMAAVGLAQNLAALRALATEGIQRGHMALHARQMAIAAGATGELVDVVAARLVREKRIRLDRAGEILRELQGAST